MVHTGRRSASGPQGSRARTVAASSGSGAGPGMDTQSDGRAGLASAALRRFPIMDFEADLGGPGATSRRRPHRAR